MGVEASVIATVSGGIQANLSVELASPSNSPHVYLDDMIQSLSGGSKPFKFSGGIYAESAIRVTTPNPVGPQITLFKYELGRYEILNFDPPPNLMASVPVVVIDQTSQHTLLLDVGKIPANSLVTVQPYHDLTVSGGTFQSDGIRVDYPGEINLFVERKDDFNTGYYNLIGLNGPLPDGVSINIVDPFRVFRDEGAPDPTPAQTKPGVLLAGGTSVVYKYTESADGSARTSC